MTSESCQDGTPQMSLAPLSDSAPWMPGETGITFSAEDHDRRVQYDWSRRISGLPGSFVYLTFSDRLHTFLTQGVGRQIDDTWPQASMYERYADAAEFVDCARRLSALDQLRANKEGKYEKSLRVSVSLYADCFRSASRRRIELPADGAPYKGEHLIVVKNIESNVVWFTHNWDGWEHSWSMPLAYVEAHFVEASYLGLLRNDAGDLKQEPLPFRFTQLNQNELGNRFGGAPYVQVSPAGAIIVVGFRRGVTVRGDAHQIQFTAFITSAGVRTIIGWAHARLVGDMIAFDELFVHTALRGRKVARALFGSALFALATRGYRTVNIVKRRADITAQMHGKYSSPEPGWLGTRWVRSEDEEVISVRLIELLTDCVMPWAGERASDRGVVYIEDFTLYEDRTYHQYGPGVGIVIDPSRLPSA